MKFGVTTYLWSAEFGAAQLSLLPHIKALGFDGAEVPLFRPRDFPATQIRRGFEAEHLACIASSVLTGDLSLISDDVSVRRRTVHHLEEVIRAAAEAGATLVAGPLYSPVGLLVGRRRTDDEWHRAIEGLQALGPTLASCGVTLAIEPLNRFETYFLNTAADACALCDAVGDAESRRAARHVPRQHRREAARIRLSCGGRPGWPTCTRVRTIVARRERVTLRGTTCFRRSGRSATTAGSRSRVSGSRSAI